ncbi:MAG: DNA polymerase III subunit beta [Verrucomicrobiota bacterium]
MKITITKDALINILNAVGGSVKANSSLPILSTVLIDAKSDGNLSMRTTNSEMELIATVAAKVQKAGSVALSHAALLRIANLTDADICINVSKSRASVTASKSKFGLPTFNAGEFPGATVLPNAGEPLLLNAQQFFDALKSAKWSMRKPGERPPLDGINLEVRDGSITVISTNGHCATITNLGETSAVDANVTLPYNVVNELVRCRCDSESEITIWLDERRVKFALPNGTEMNSAIHDTRYPNWRQVIPTAVGEPVEVNRKRLILGLQRLLVAASDNDRAALMRFNPGVLELSIAAEGREAKDQIEVKCDIQDRYINLNIEYFLAALGSVNDEAVTIVFRDELNALEIKTANGLFIIMPVRKQ